MNVRTHTARGRCWVAASLLALSGAVVAQDLVIGQTLPLTGTSGSTIAEELRRGRQACVDHVNAQGGIRGQRLRLVTRDDQGDAGLAVALSRELAEREGAVAMLGSMGPALNIAQLEWARSAGMPVVGPYGGDIEVRVRDSTAFFITANQGAEAARLASHIASLGIKDVAILHGSDRAGMAARTALEEAFGLSGARIVAFVPVAADGHNAARSAVAVQRAKAQAVVLATSGGVTTAVLRAFGTGAPEGGVGVLQTYGLSSAASQAELRDVGEGARGFSMSQVVPFPRDPRLAVVSTFQTAMRGAPGERSHAELEGCMGPLLLAEVLRRKPVDASRAGVLQALKTAGRVSIGGFEVDLSDRTKPGSHFTDIVYIGPNGKMYR